MTPGTDPYRTLGVSRGASAEEIRRAYRALAKVNHPDAAGPLALPRFLAIQAAYEQLVTSGAARRGARGSSSSPSGSSGPARPSAADPDRADAAHRAYGGRPRRGRGAAPGSASPGSDTTPGSGGAAGGGTDPAAGGSSAGGSGRSAGGARSRPDTSQARGPRATGGADRPAPGTAGARDDSAEADPSQPKATFGSTSYDGVDQLPFEPDWGGASWYGTTSGTYWTINPKEYADPRKHGPEYQARARRRTGRHAGAGGDANGGSGSADAQTDPAGDVRAAHGDAAHDEAAPRRRPDPPPAAERDRPSTGGSMHEPSSWWASPLTEGDHPYPPGSPRTTGPRGGTADRPETMDRSAPRAEPWALASDEPPPDLATAATDLGRALTDERTGRGRWRLVQALIAWLPILFGVAWLVGELTGCGRFAASCSVGEPVVAPVVGLLVLGILLLSPWLAAVTATGAVALVVTAVPTALLLSAGGTAIDVQSRSDTLGIVLVIAWVAGIAFAVARRVRSMGSRARPVS